MSWWLWLLLAWLALSVPLGILVGRAIRQGQRGDVEEDQDSGRHPAPGPPFPAPRDGRQDRSA